MTNVFPSALRLVQPAATCLLFLLCCTTLYAGGWTLPKGRLFLKAYGGVSTAGSYYDTDGKLIAEKRMEIQRPDDTVRTRVIETYDFTGIMGGVYGEYGLTDDLTVVLDVPVGHFELTRKNLVSRQFSDDIVTREQVDTVKSLTTVTYYGLGARYRIGQSDKMISSLSAMVHVPPGFSSPIIGNPDYPFLSDGAFEVRGGLELGFPASFGWAGISAMYNWRGEELKDELLVHAEAGFNKVENAFFKVHIDVVQSLSSFKDARNFEPNETQLQENYLSAGASFSLFFSKAWFVDIDYSVRVFGENTWNLSNIILGTGLILDEL
jgi:hypothetical protein